MAREISNSDSVIDSRDVIARIEELEAERERIGEEAEEAAGEDADGTERAEAETAWDATEEGEELTTLKALAEEGESSPDWPHGETLIRDSYFRDYAEQLADDIGAIDTRKSRGWPLDYIDWDAAAEALQQDYMSVDFGGVTYWIRA